MRSLYLNMTLLVILWKKKVVFSISLAFCVPSFWHVIAWTGNLVCRIFNFWGDIFTFCITSEGKATLPFNVSQEIALLNWDKYKVVFLSYSALTYLSVEAVVREHTQSVCKILTLFCNFSHLIIHYNCQLNFRFFSSFLRHLLHDGFFFFSSSSWVFCISIHSCIYLQD